MIKPAAGARRNNGGMVMNDETTTDVAPEAAPAAPELAAIDEEAAIEGMSHEQALAYLRARQNFALAVPAGIAAAVAGALLWAAVVALTGYALGLIAIAIGAGVGFAVRWAGKGVDQKFGILGAVCAAFGWALGTVMADVAVMAQVADVSWSEVLTRLGPDGIVSLVVSAADMMDVIFLAIAVYEGYRFAFKYKLA